MPKPEGFYVAETPSQPTAAQETAELAANIADVGQEMLNFQTLCGKLESDNIEDTTVEKLYRGWTF